MTHAADPEMLRNRWIAILQNSYEQSNAIRLENSEEEEYYYNAEMLADKLITGFDPDNSLIVRGKLPSALASKAWNAVAIGSTGLLAVFPLVVFFNDILPLSFCFSSMSFLVGRIASMHTSITPYLLPTIETIQTSVRDQLIQAQSVIASLPYLLKHIGRIKLIPLATKLVRKCIILEAWRHIWIRIYKISRRVWKGTKVGSVKVYTKFVPAWIRRGINSTFKSMVQAQVHGVVGSAVGGFYVSFFGDGGQRMGDSLEEVIETSVDASVSVAGEQIVESVLESTEPVAESVIAEAVSVGLSSAVEDSSTIEKAVSDVITEGIASSVEDAADIIATEIMTDSLE